MKKIIKKIVVMVLIISAVGLSLPVCAAEPAIGVTVDGKAVNFPDAKPFIDASGRILIPLRFVSEKFGAAVEWIQNEQKVIIKKDSTEIILHINRSDFTVNGKNKTMDTKAIIKDTRTFIPIRYVVEALGGIVKWDAGTKTVMISKTNTDTPKPDVDKDKDIKGKNDNKDYGSKPKDTDPNILWSYIAEGSYVYYASPALSSDEKTVYFGTSFAIKSPQSDKDRLIALNTADGTLKWEYYTNKGEIRSNLKVFKDNIYFIADYGRDGETREKAELIAVSPNGEELWRKTIANSNRMHAVGRSGVDVKNDKVVAVTDYLYVFDYLTGKELDKVAINPNPNYMPYVRPVINSNSAYFLLGGILYEYNLETSVLTKKEMSKISSSLSKASGTNDIRFDSDNNMYIGSGSLIISLDKDKNHRWTYDSGNEKISFRSSPAINESNRLMYIGTKNNEESQLLAINIDTGKLEWSYDTGGDVYSSPALYKGLIYACAEKGYMHILKEDGTLVQKISVNEEITWPSPVIDKLGILYIAGMGDGKSKGFLYGIKTLKSDEP